MSWKPLFPGHHGPWVIAEFPETYETDRSPGFDSARLARSVKSRENICGSSPSCTLGFFSYARTSASGSQRKTLSYLEYLSLGTPLILLVLSFFSPGSHQVCYHSLSAIPRNLQVSASPALGLQSLSHHAQLLHGVR